MRAYFIYILIMTSTLCSAQSKEWNDYFYELYDVAGMADADDSYQSSFTEQMEEDYERLCELETAPLNINTATVEELEQIPGLSIDQIDKIIYYRDRYGEFKTLAELGLIESIDNRLRNFLCNFLVAEPTPTGKWYQRPSIDSIMRKGHGEVIAYASIPLYSRAGDKNGYLGYKYKYSLKLTGKFSDNIRYGFCGAQDAGEPLFRAGNSWGMDQYTGYININNVWRIRKFVIGTYKIKFGLGLIQNNGFSAGKQMMLSAIDNSETTISGHATRSDGGYFQGIATTLDLGRKNSTSKWNMTTFWSFRAMDATLNSDSAVSTILTSGYHRTQTEMNKKDNTNALACGVHIGWKYNRWHAGISAVYDWFNRDLVPLKTTDTNSYKTYYPSGSSFWNVSVDYGYVSSGLTFSGETASGGCGAIATLNSIKAKVAHSLTIIGIQRFYSYKYTAINAKAFNDGGRVQNESGMYLGAQWNISRRLALDAYSDISYFPWLKYMVAASSYSWDNSLGLTYTRNNWTWNARYRFRLRQRNNADKSAIVNRYTHRLRIYALRTGEKVEFKTQVDLNYFTTYNSNSFGYAISENMKANIGKKSRLYVTAIYFDTDDYSSSIYVNEHNLNGAFSIPSYYGRGIRFATSFQYDFTRHWGCSAKVGLNLYFNRNTISSNLRMINSSHQEDVDFNIKYKF